MGFNRYMVECKSERQIHALFAKFVLIDTWWNVNNDYIFVQHFAKSFNRYMVECKS